MIPEISLKKNREMQALVVKRSRQSVIGMGNPFTAISIYHSAPILEKSATFGSLTIYICIKG